MLTSTEMATLLSRTRLFVAFGSRQSCAFVLLPLIGKMCRYTNFILNCTKLSNIFFSIRGSTC